MAFNAGGLAEGLRAGIGAYQEERGLQEQRRRALAEEMMKKQMMGMEAASKGLIQGPTGEYAPSPLTLAKQQEEMKSYEPLSPDYAEQLATGLEQVTGEKGSGDLIRKSVGKATRKEAEAHYDKLLSAGATVRAGQVRGASFNDFNERRTRKIDEDQAAQAAKDISNDDIIKGQSKIKSNFINGRNILIDENGNLRPVSSQRAAGLATDIARMISGNATVAEGRQEKEEWNSAATKWETLLQNIKNSPGDVLPEPVKRSMLELINETERTSNQLVKMRYDLKKAGHLAAHPENPLVKKSIEAIEPVLFSEGTGFKQKQPAGLIEWQQNQPGGLVKEPERVQGKDGRWFKRTGPNQYIPE